MILEVADIRIVLARQAEFEQAVHHGLQTVISKAKGFRGSAAFTQWRSIVAEFFVQSPFTEHFNTISPQSTP